MENYWKASEELATKYLEKNGYKILERNYRTKFGEIDIIAKKLSTYVFVEVKSGSSNRIRPVDRINVDKIRRISKVADFYLKDKNFSKARIDVIEIWKGEIKHYEDVGWDYL